MIIVVVAVRVVRGTRDFFIMWYQALKENPL